MPRRCKSPRTHHAGKALRRIVGIRQPPGNCFSRVAPPAATRVFMVAPGAAEGANRNDGIVAGSNPRLIHMRIDNITRRKADCKCREDGSQRFSRNAFLETRGKVPRG